MNTVATEDETQGIDNLAPELKEIIIEQVVKAVAKDAAEQALKLLNERLVVFVGIRDLK